MKQTEYSKLSNYDYNMYLMNEKDKKQLRKNIINIINKIMCIVMMFGLFISTLYGYICIGKIHLAELWFLTSFTAQCFFSYFFFKLCEK